MSLLRTLFRVFVAGLAAVPISAQSVTYSSSRYPVDDYVTHGDAVYRRARVVDGLTGKPLAGAELFLIKEHTTPLRGAFWFARRAVADADGFLSIRVDEKAKDYKEYDWVCIRAEGYAPRMQMGWFEDVVVQLAPAQTVPIRLVDWRDRPVPDALIGFCKGCGHTPDLAHARTDAQGIARIAGIDLQGGIADFYIEHPRLALGYDALRWVPGQQPVRWRVAPQPATHGVVFDAAGKPLAGAFVGVKDVHRGPWTKTDRNGGFRLCGADQGLDLFVSVAGDEYLFERPVQAPFRLRLPKRDPTIRKGSVQVVETAAVGERPEPQPPQGVPVVVRVTDLPAEAEVSIQTRTRTIDIVEAIRRGEPVRIPKEPFVFVVEEGGQQRVVEPDRAQLEKTRRTRLAWYRPTRIEGRVVDGHGNPVAAQLQLVESFDYVEDDGWQATQGAIALKSEGTGLRYLCVRDAKDDFAPRILPVLLPERGDDASVEVGRVVLRKNAELTVPAWDDLDREVWQVTFFRAGYCRLDRGIECEVDYAGRCHVPDLRPGDAVVLRRTKPEEGFVDVPTRLSIAGRGPWRLEVPKGELRVVAKAAGGGLVGVTIGETSVRDVDPFVFRGLAPGRHVVFLAAAGHRSARVEVEVPRTGQGKLEVTLPRRE